MKMPKVLRPEVEIEYMGVYGFLCALLCMFKIWIKKVPIDYTINGETVMKHKFFVIPKYRIARGRMGKGCDVS